MSSCAVAQDGSTIIAGDRSGRTYFLRLEEANGNSQGEIKLE